MIRKVLKVTLIAVAVLLVLYLFVGREAASYVRTTAGYMTDAVQESIPIEFQIDRARDMIKDLIPEVRKNMHLIAKEEVEVQKLNEQIEETEVRLTKEKAQILQLKNDLADDRDAYRYAGRTYTAGEVRNDLARRFERFKTADATLASLQEMRNARQRSLQAARQKLEGMMAAKRQLQVEVEHLEARAQMLAAAQTTSSYHFDDSRLGHLKELIAGLRTRLQVAERLVNAETNFHDEIPLDQPAPENIEQQITEYFAPAPKPYQVTAK
jgi:predicted  nucleic acid-binding Zn-ribbon protein